MNSLVRRFSVQAEERRLIKPSQLPVYDEEEEPKFVLVSSEPGVLEQNIKVARESLNLVTDQVSEVGAQINHVIETGKAHSQGAYNQLLDEENLPARIGVIAGGGLLGLLVGSLRGRMFKRLLYTTFGAGAGAAVCYPEEANEISADAYAEIRKKAMIAYNFVNGVEPSNENAEANLIASSISRFSRIVFRYVTEMREKIIPTASSGLNSSSMEAEKSRKDQVIFEGGQDTSSVVVAGDPGQSKEEDKDLYTTRK